MCDDAARSGRFSRRDVLRATGGFAGATIFAGTGSADALTITQLESKTRIESGALTVVIQHDPFGVAFEQPDAGAPTGLGLGGDPHPATGAPPDDIPGRGADRRGKGPLDDDPKPDGVDQYGTVGFAIGDREMVEAPYPQYGTPIDGDLAWIHATSVESHDGATFELATTDPTRTVTLSVTGDGAGRLRLQADLSDDTGVVKTGWSFQRADDERFLGFGERSDGVDQTGKLVENWCEQGPFSSGAASPAADPTLGERYQGPPPNGEGTNFPMPWFVSSEKYGFLLESDHYNRFHLGSDREDLWHVETWESTLAFDVFAGPTPADTVERFSSYVGRQPEPAKWFFGPWFQAAGSTEERRQLTENWRTEWDVPVTVRETSTHYTPCAAQAGQRAFLRDRTDHAHRLGYKITAYVTEHICNNHPNGKYEEGGQNGYFYQTPGGETYPVLYLTGGFGAEHNRFGVVDFTNSEATEWWQGLIQKPIDDGFDGWMEDFGGQVPPKAVAADGRRGYELHNRHPVLYHKASHQLTTGEGAGGDEYDRGRDFGQFVRSGYTGSAQYSRIVWGGDPSEDWSKSDGLAAAVSQGQSMGLSGVAYWRTDIGGFHALTKEERTDDELLIRWLEYGAFNGLMATRSRSVGREGSRANKAKVWDEGVRPIWRKFCKLRTQLFPYIWEHALAYQETGLPLIRHLALHFPDDAEVYAADAEYEFLFGPDILVAPVITEGGRERTVYLPEGETWVNFWDAVDYEEESGAYQRRGPIEFIEGGQYVAVDAPLDEIPLFVRAGTKLTLLPPDVDTIATPEETRESVTTLAETNDRRRLVFPAGR